MLKDPTRDYITEAFRLYARWEKPTYEQACNMIYESELEKYINTMPPDRAIVKAEKAVDKQTSTLLDIMAVEKTLHLLKQDNKEQITSAVEAVYFTDPKAQLRKGDISNRVRRYAYENHTDERTVYRWLKEARLLCAAVRGLSIRDTRI